jgi:hypothetical protein
MNREVGSSDLPVKGYGDPDRAARSGVTSPRSARGQVVYRGPSGGERWSRVGLEPTSSTLARWRINRCATATVQEPERGVVAGRIRTDVLRLSRATHLPLCYRDRKRVLAAGVEPASSRFMRPRASTTCATTSEATPGDVRQGVERFSRRPGCRATGASRAPWSRWRRTPGRTRGDRPRWWRGGPERAHRRCCAGRCPGWSWRGR